MHPAYIAMFLENKEVLQLSRNPFKQLANSTLTASRSTAGGEVDIQSTQIVFNEV